ncbi:unnamed protein product [Protopolystoma xenopodis]|uniref:Uncharacterized protein n=1 Tax=Protopolystoma xenopodis TaxID=117903 RepID=A0A448XCZ7_9PLAT|nr:unnamed protein product [Protopolystoma xenopodis]
MAVLAFVLHSAPLKVHHVLVSQKPQYLSDEIQIVRVLCLENASLIREIAVRDSDVKWPFSTGKVGDHMLTLVLTCSILCENVGLF